MSGSVLFDAPGPATTRRHRLYSALTVLALLSFLGFVLYRLGATGQLESAKWEPFVTPDYVKAIAEGALDTVQMALTAVLAALVFGAVFGIGKLSDHGLMRWPSWAIVEFFRAVPVLLLMILIYYIWGINADGGSYWSVALALMAYNGAVLAEVVRAGILAVPKGQAEAAYALGMRKSQVMLTILLPQAVKIMVPAIISQCVVALKDTSLGYAILAPGLSTVGKSIYQQFNNQVPTIIVISAIYIVLNLILTALATWAQRKFVGERRQIDPAMAAIVTQPGGKGAGAGDPII